MNTAPGFGAFLLVAFLIAFYFLPTIVAACRRHLSTGAIIVLNILLGWTFLGWVIALVWACSSNTRRNRIETAQVTANVMVRTQEAVAGAGLLQDARPGVKHSGLLPIARGEQRGAMSRHLRTGVDRSP